MNKNIKIDYFSRDFASIKESLQNYAIRYYPNTIYDLSETSINSFMIEAVSYVGDVLSFYLDYQTNETFLSTAVENKNILELASIQGYKIKENFSASGKIAIYILVPDKDGSLDYSVLPIIKKGSEFQTPEGAVFTLTEDVKITQESVGTRVVVSKVNSVGKPLYYAVKVYAPVVSGRIVSDSYEIDSFVPYRKIYLNNSSTTEIISVRDSDNNIYYEVPNLSQATVTTSDLNIINDEQKYLLKTIYAQRRFVFDNSPDLGAFLMFGAARYEPEKDLGVNPIVEPNKYILNKYNNDYLQDSFFEPGGLVSGDNFGIGPENTTLEIISRVQNFETTNVDINKLNRIRNLQTSYSTLDKADSTKKIILNSIQVTNEEVIVGNIQNISIEDIREQGKNIFASQGRAVTSKDYETICYMMPPKFGAIKRVKVTRDPTSLKNNINIYTLAEGPSNTLIKANSTLKENLKTWISQYKLLTDSVDILDAKIINLGIHFVVMADPAADKLSILSNVLQKLRLFYLRKPNIGEYFNILDVYKIIRAYTGILDIKDVKVYNKTGIGYSSTPFSVHENLTSDGTVIKIPKNAIFEIKTVDVDITGDVI